MTPSKEIGWVAVNGLLIADQCLLTNVSWDDLSKAWYLAKRSQYKVLDLRSAYSKSAVRRMFPTSGMLP